MSRRPTWKCTAPAPEGFGLQGTWCPIVFVLAAMLLGGVATPSKALAPGSSDSPRRTAPGVAEPESGSLLVEYYETLLDDHDLDAFRQRVPARYTRGSLARLVESPDLSTRRAAIFALGLFGGYENNALLARALRDHDPVVRNLAQDALWAVWFRADTPENNQKLEEVRSLIGRGHLDEAHRMATHLIGRAPKFAEAYNQRAIAEFFRGQFEESAADCRRTLELNPYHTGALGGLAQCELRLNRRADAIKTMRRAQKLQPHQEELRRAISVIESLPD